MRKKILIVNPFGIGDVIFSTPLVEILKKNFPDSRIGYVCNKRVSELMEANPCIDKIFIYEKDDYRDAWKNSRIKCIKKIMLFLNDIRKERFDISIDLSLAYQNSMLLKLIGIKKRIGLNYRNRGRFLTDRMDIRGFDSKHVIEYYLDMLRPLKIERGSSLIVPVVYLSSQNVDWANNFLKDNGITAGDKLAGLIPGCGASWGKDAHYRRWSPWKFAEVADHIAGQHNYKILLFGDPKEIPLCEEVRGGMKTKPVVSCGKTTLGQMAALLDKCDLVVTNDGGPLHMAVALKKKIVAIFGPVDEKVYGPYPQAGRYITVTSNVRCRPCYKNFKYGKCDTLDCLKNIKPADVINAVEKLMGS